MAGFKLSEMKDTDTVEYFIYPEFSQNGSKEISLTQLQETQEHVMSYVKTLCENYIWHNDEFNIIQRNVFNSVHGDVDDVNDIFSYYGCVNYGENIEDEWFVVYLLIEITKKFNNLVVRVKDADGEFLLIEAADYLPKWVTPETCEDKVFIYQGNIHILPKSFRKKDDVDLTKEAVRYLRSNVKQTLADSAVQKCIKDKLTKYPSNLNELQHSCNLYLPVAIAALLDATPQLVSCAVRAFCERDLVDLKACRAMKYFPPETTVVTNVRFTRCLYAMLVSSKYNPDRRTGWNLPVQTDETYHEKLTGAKLACGFEILVSQARQSKPDKENPDSLNFESDTNWKHFIKSLQSNNYFRDLIEGSKPYNQLLDEAKEFYRQSCRDLFKPNSAKKVASLLESLEYDVEEYKRHETKLPPSDDDAWLNITKQDLDQMLEARFGKKPDTNGEQPTDLVNQLNGFINGISGLDGVEFPRKPGSQGPARPKRGIKKKAKTVKFSPDTKIQQNAVGTNRINLESEGFISAIQNILDFKIDDDNYWESEGSGMSSYEDEADMELGDPTKKKPGPESLDNEMIQYMDDMDKELAAASLPNSYISATSTNTGKESAGSSSKVNDSFDDIETFEPVNIDLSVLKNMLTSYKSQMGEAGPAENLLGPMGINLDDVEADVD